MKMYSKCKFCNSNYNLKLEKYNLVECESCKLIFCKKQFSQKEIENVYDFLYNKKGDSHYDMHSKEEFTKLKDGKIPNIGYNRKRFIDKCIINKSNSVLEVGSGIGLIGSYLKSKGVLDYLGLEIDYNTYKKSKELGLNTTHADFSYMKNINKNFDIIMLWEVLEHIQDLGLFLKLAMDKLKTKGVLLFSVPNFKKIHNYDSVLTGDNLFQDEPPIHLNFFTKESLSNILTQKGFFVNNIYVKRTPYLNFKSAHFYKMLYKSIHSKYQGSTIYVMATKLK